MSVWDGINWAASGRREKHQSLAPAVSCQPLRMGMLSGEKTVTSRLEKVTVQSASQIVMTPSNVCLNVSRMWPVVGKAWTSWEMADLAVPEERATWLFAVPTHTFGAVVSVFLRVTSGA